MFRMGCQIKDPKSRIFAFVRKEDGSKHQRPQFVTSRGDDPWNIDNINWAYDRRGKQTYYIAEEIMHIAQKVNGIAVRGHVVNVNSIRCVDRSKDGTREGNGVWCLVWNTSKTILPPMPLEAWEQRNIKKFKKPGQGQKMPKRYYDETQKAKGSPWWNENTKMTQWEACSSTQTDNAQKLKEQLLTAVGYNKDDAIFNLKNIVFIGEMATQNNEGKRSLHEANAFLNRYGINFNFETLSDVSICISICISASTSISISMSISISIYRYRYLSISLSIFISTSICISIYLYLYLYLMKPSV
jgi:hypothetical protein